jgi:glycosyltransferase involved in cell wall biosynthesis
MTAPLLTVLVITGGRDPLPALEASILSNRRDDVEWLVVDNSRTPLRQVDDIQGTPVRWLTGPAGDGHASFNRGVAAALGSLVLPLLAGDELHPASVSRVINEWRRIPLTRSGRFSGITGLLATPADIDGDPDAAAAGMESQSLPFPFETADREPAELRYRTHWQGEPLFAMRVELLRARPLPSPGDALPPLGMVWRTAGRGFMTHAINVELGVRAEPPLSTIFGDRLDAAAKLTFDERWHRTQPRAFFEAARDFQRLSRTLGISRREQWQALSTRNAKAFWLAALPTGRKRRTPQRATPAAVARRSAFKRPIVLITRSLDLAGAERQLVTLAIGFHQRKIDVRVLVFYGGPLERDLRDAGVPLTILEKQGRWDIFSFLRRLSRELRAAKPAVVHGYLPMPNLLALVLKPLHHGQVVWGIRATRGGPNGSEWMAKLVDRTEQKLSRFVPLLISNSQAGRSDAIEAGFPADRTIVIPNGVDLERFRRDEEGRARLRTVWHVPDGAPLIGRVGRIDPQKDYPTFLRAAAIVAKQHPDARFVCVGGGPNALVEQLKRLGNELGLSSRLIWTGPIQVMASAYSAMDICVSSSAYGEGVPNVVAEAMACGTPVIATNVGDSAWTVADERFIVSIADPPALAETIMRMLDDIDAGLVDGGTLRARIERELSVDRLLDRTEQALLELSAH